jgi:putative NADPH-quinone reductase/4-hydroxybenzoate polyprenyltransferase
MGRRTSVRRLALRDLSFDFHVRCPRPQDQSLEPDLREALALLRAADHLVFVYPTWWGSMPALLKGFLDRVMLPGIAFRERAGHEGYEAFWQGKTADLITTMDTPPAVHRWIFGRPGLQALGKATLAFCGVRVARMRMFGPVNGSSPAQRMAWHQCVQLDAMRLASGRPLDRRQILLDRVRAWLAAMRLQFHPMVWLAYLLGALAACAGRWHEVGGAAFWVGLAGLFVLETLTVLVNEWFDRDSDRRNTHHGPFNGGARVLVDGRLSERDFRWGFAICSGLLLGLLPVGISSFQPDALVVAAPLAVLAIGYTAPPLALCWRGLGEITVAVTNGLAPVLMGWVAQRGDPFAAEPWLLGLPIALAILPAITLATLPDRDADAAAGKRTLAVMFGAGAAIRLGQAGAIAALITAALIWPYLAPAASDEAPMVLLVAPIAIHARAVLARCQALLARAGAVRRIDGPLILALSYIPWFVAWPLIALSSGP